MANASAEYHPFTLAVNEEQAGEGSRGKRTLILGIGNVLLGDEGIGVHAIPYLQMRNLPGRPELIDGGTGGFQLLSLFDEYDPIIMIDATLDAEHPGTVRVTQPRFVTDFPRSLSAHDIGLRDLLESAQLLAPLPRLFLITVSIQRLDSLTTSLSDPVAGALPAIEKHVRSILLEIGRN